MTASTETAPRTRPVTPTFPEVEDAFERTTNLGGVGTNAERPDAVAKSKGEFAYASDLHRDRMLWGVTLRSPHPYALVNRIDVSAALATPGVHAVLTHDDVPGSKVYGMKVADQPVLAGEVTRYQGEPVAVLAAESLEIGKRALNAIVVEYDVLEPLTDPDRALDPDAPRLHPGGNLVRHVKIRHGDVAAARVKAAVVVEGTYEVGMQDQCFLGPEAGLAVPVPGGVELHVASQWLHDDQHQVAACLDLPLERVRIVASGVGGAFGGREDLSVHIHASLLALRTGRPVKMSYGREESFFGHVHRHPARMHVEHGVTNDGRIAFVAARLLFDGGAYASTSNVVIANASYFAAGAYDVPNVQIDGIAVYTNNPPCGAMRGFGTVQAIYAVESNMDKLARALATDPLELRLENAATVGSVLPTGQVLDGPVPIQELLDELRKAPLPSEERYEGVPDPRFLPGGVGNVNRGERVRRGIGYALGMKAIAYSGGADDYSTARVSLSIVRGEPVAEVATAAVECGQGILTVQAQIARTELGVDRVVFPEASTSLPNAGSSSASRQTWMTGGAVKGACERVRLILLQRAADFSGEQVERLGLRNGRVVDHANGRTVIPLADLLDDRPVSAEFEFRHRPTEPIDPETGQGKAHVAFAFCAHRAVVDVDVELGLVRVVELAAAEDVGRALNPLAVEGQIEGATAQGLGLALLEEMKVVDGEVKNPSFTDYLIPTILDMPPMRLAVLEIPHPDAPYGVNGVGELASLSATPAIVNALRDATGLELPRVPVSPEDIVAGKLQRWVGSSAGPAVRKEAVVS